MRTLLYLIGCLIISSGVQAEGISFYNGKWKAALAQAKAQDKLIFLDAYTAWCGPCKAMAKTVFKEKAVGEFYNENFVNMKIDMEKGEGPGLARKYKVKAYPTFLFVDGDGNIVVESKGRKRTEQFINLGRAALKKFDKSVPLAKEYEKGNKKPEFLKKYALALVRAKKPHLKVVNEYLNTQKDLATDENLNAIFAFATEADSKVFDLLIEHKAAIEKLQGKATVQAAIEKACLATVEKAVEYEVPDLMTDAKGVITKHYPKRAKAFSLEADMQYAIGTKDANQYLKAAKKYISKFAKKDASKQHAIAVQIHTQFRSSPVAMKAAEKYAKKAAESSGNMDYYISYSKILASNNQKEAAVRVLMDARKLAQKKKQPTDKIDQFLRTIK